ncbi:MAG: MGMT family protein [Nanoarchaeota archaeon]|nr:MGMT family protein [Nanoarchaeota archaeon]
MVFKLPKKEGFAHAVYAKLLRVPKGKVTTYAALAHAVGTRAYRAIGQVMNKNPYAPDVPCHRVISSDGNLGGYAGGEKRKLAMLKAEGIVFKNGKVEEKYILREL